MAAISLTELFRKRIFILINMIGFFSLVINLFIKNQIILSLSMTFFTMGITLPIALYFQMRQSGESFNIIKACNFAGIESIIVSREDQELKLLIENCFKDTKNIFLQGIAFPELLDYTIAPETEAKKRLRNSAISLSVLLLNPESNAAKRRAQIEDPDQITGNWKTIENINRTIDDLTLFARSRIEDKYSNNNVDWKQKISELMKNNGEFITTIKESINFNVKLYDFDPIVFIIGTDNYMFSEQYHFGRPNFIKYTATCIGGHVPVLLYKKDSKAYLCLKSHFDYVWKSSETKDITSDLIRKAIKAIRVV